MAFFIPSLSDCVRAARQSFRAYLPGTDAWLWPNNIGPSAKVIGGSAWEIFNRLDYVQRAKFALTAEHGDLDDHGAEFGIPRKASAPASGQAVITATAAMALAAGGQLQRGDGVIVTAPTGGAVSGAGTFTIDVIANVAALAGNSQGGAALTIIAGGSGPGAATATAVVAADGLTGGADVEPDGQPFSLDLATYRGRILFRKQHPIQGGAPSDYVSWATEVTGVTRVFVERLYNGPGSVRVYPLFDDLFAATGGVADAAHIGLVQLHLAGLQPAAAQVSVTAPAGQLVPVTVTGLTPDTTPTRQAVADELADTFRRFGRVAGIDPASAAIAAALPFLATAFSFASIWAGRAVADATGDQRAILTAPAADVAITASSIPVLGAVSFL